jgi:hypothetical protein
MRDRALTRRAFHAAIVAIRESVFGFAAGLTLLGCALGLLLIGPSRREKP